MIFLLVLAQVSVGQEINRLDIVKFKIKSIAVLDGDGKTKYILFYNDNGYIITQGSLNESKQIQIDQELFYNDSSLLIEERKYAIGGDVTAASKYYYDDKQQLLKKEYISFGEVSAIWTFAYDKNGNKITETQTSGTMGNTSTIYKYDDKNFLIQEDKTNDKIGKEEKIDYRYNNKGQVAEKKNKILLFQHNNYIDLFLQ